MILKTKLNESFPISQFQIDGYRMRQGWLINCSYDPPKTFIGEDFELLSKNLDLQSSKYDRFVFIDDFNVGMENEAMKDFYNLQRLISLNNKPNCYKIPWNPSCIDLILTNCPKYFQNATVVETIVIKHP